MLIKARAACDIGQIGEATMLYDQLICKIADNNDPLRGDSRCPIPGLTQSR